jgi:hypothetical protein
LCEKLFGGYIVNGEQCELDFKDIRRRMVSLQNKNNSYDALSAQDPKPVQDCSSFSSLGKMSMGENTFDFPPNPNDVGN